MDKRDTGGQAFPNPALADADYRTQPGDMGMTLRDWFAGQALAGVLKICKDDSTEPGQERQQMFAARAYELADAMLEARK